VFGKEVVEEAEANVRIPTPHLPPLRREARTLLAGGLLHPVAPPANVPGAAEAAAVHRSHRNTKH
jgi:hypothetical protein